MKAEHQGGCQCGALRYQINAPLEDIAHCHCLVCRRSTGGILTTWVTVPRETFHWLSGTLKAFKLSASCTRYFCADCGAHLALFTSLSPHTLDVTVATLDEPEQAPADRHIWVGSRLPWLRVDPQLPEEWQEEID
ncbi:GFA family protein [Pseudomonas sediminis]|uniref:GFA family protein n=1 Tax=Pseudomonas TaxID=286 RepID=UPI000CA8D647|nr:MULTISPECIES: GFA family protein [Pseudomonas]MDG9760564.1 GFA family protein [Pseudomonas sediminis]PKQ40993.1 aldehyde-activating protein [Pseudomonas sp. YY-1]